MAIQRYTFCLVRLIPLLTVKLTRNIKMILGSLKTRTFFGENDNQKAYETLVDSLQKIKNSSPELYHTLTVPEEPVVCYNSLKFFVIDS